MNPLPGPARAAALLMAAASLLAVPSASPAQDGGGESDATTTLDGIFTADQAERGEEVFSEACARCHPTSRFVGATFQPSWSQAPVATLFTIVRTQMPFDNPGSLDGDEYAAVLAYIFELNDLPAGDRELPASADSLRDYTIRFDTSDGESGRDARSRPPPHP